MPVFYSKSKQFYDMVNESDKVSEEMKVLIGNNDTGFYELCKCFADIGINAPKFKDEKSLSIQGVFQFKDIDAAKAATVCYIREHNIKEVNQLLDTIHEFHRYAVDWDDKRQSSGIYMSHGSSGCGVGVYADFAKLPDEQWNIIAKEIRDMTE